MSLASLARHVGVKCAVIGGALGIALLAVEATARILGLGPAPSWRSEGDPLLRDCGDAVLRFENNPSSHSRQVYGLPGGGEQVAEFTIDGFGLRGGGFPREKPPGVFRVACVGDSYTFGDGVSDDETWPHHLQQRLDPSREGIQVLNCGVNAYETEQEVRLLETRVLDFQPDVVVLAYFINDACIRSRAGSNRVLREVQPPAISSFLSDDEGWFASVRDRSCFLTWYVDQLRLRKGLEYFGSSRTALFADDATGWIASRQILHRARELLRRAKVPFVVALYPFMYREGEHLATHEAYAVVSAFLAKEKIRCLDLEPAYAGHDVDELRVHPRNAHTNGRGHAIAAAAIAEYLVAEELVPSGAGPAAGSIAGR